jgi:hypothetical protein
MHHLNRTPSLASGGRRAVRQTSEDDGMAHEQSWLRRSAPVAVATVALFLLHVVLTSKVSGPTVVFDENGYLGNARALVGGGRGRWEMPFGPFYSGGYSVLLVPALALWRDPDQAWRAVQLTNAVLLASLLPLLYAVARTVLAVPPRRALASASAAALVPAALAAGPSAVAENLVLPLVAATVLAAWAMTDTDAGLRFRRLWFGPLAALAYAAHPRFTLGLLLALVLLGWWGVRHRRDLAVVAINAVGLIGTAALAWGLNRHLKAVRWVAGVEQLEGSPGTWWDLVTSADGLGELALTAVGQAWYLVVGSLGLVVVGLAALVRAVRSGDGLASEAGAATATEAERRRTVLTYLLVVAAGVFATSVLFFAQNQFRADHYVYGRHNDSFTPLWVAAGLALVLDRARARAALVAVAASAATIAGLGLVLSLLRSPSDLFEIFSPFAVPAIARFADSRPSDVFIEGTLFGLGGALLLAAAVWTIDRRVADGRPRQVAQGLVLVGFVSWCGWAGYGVVGGTAKFADGIYEFWGPVPVLERLDLEELCIDASAARARANLSYPWYLPEVDVRTYDAAAGQQPPCPLAIARLDDDARIAAGDRIAIIDQGGYYPFWEAPDGLALWVASGPEQERLDQLGALLPPGFPTVLPDEAQAGDVDLVDPPSAPVEVAPGGRVRLATTVAHQGSGAPWPDVFSFNGPERVRVLAQITPLDPDGVAGGRSGGELLAWLLPGDETGVDVEVVAVDQFLAPLPPGRYDVQLGVGQDGEDWFTDGGDDARFELVVTDGA